MLGQGPFFFILKRLSRLPRAETSEKEEREGLELTVAYSRVVKRVKLFGGSAFNGYLYRRMENTRTAKIKSEK